MSRRLEIAAAVSILLHLAILAGVGGVLTARMPQPATPDTPDVQPMIELRMIEQQGVGDPSAGAPQTATPEAAAKPPPHAPSSATPPKPPSDASGAEVPDTQAAVAMGRPVPTPSDTTVAQPVPPTPPPAAPLEMNLGGTDSDSTAVASGPGIIPAALDQRARNRPPVYPEDAARLGQQGAVVLLIHVSPDGAVTGSDVQETSGYESLDQAARQAVARWRFRPGMKDGQPVASDMPMRFVFEFD